MKIVRRCLVLLGLLGCSLAAQAQRTPVPVMNFEKIPVSLSTNRQLTADQVKSAFIAAGKRSQWAVVAKGDDTLEATVRKNSKHVVTVAISYSSNAYSIRYVSSVDMKYGDSLPSSYERSTNGKSPGTLAAEAQNKLFAGLPEAPYERPDAKAVIHPFYEHWLHALLDEVRAQLRAAPGAAS